MTPIQPRPNDKPAKQTGGLDIAVDHAPVHEQMDFLSFVRACSMPPEAPYTLTQWHPNVVHAPPPVIQATQG